MRKALSITLLALFTYNVAGYALAYLLLVHVNSERMEMKRRAEPRPEDLVRIAVPLDETNRTGEPHPEELQIRGAWYDVVRSEVQGDSIVAFCLRDGNEEALNAGLGAHIERHVAGDDAPRNHALLKTVTEEFTMQDALADLLVPRANRRFVVIADSPISHPDSIPTPPPRG